MAIWRKTAALSVPLATIAMMFLSAAPSQAVLCNAGFVYGIAVDGSKVCVPLTKEVVGILGATLAPATKTPEPAPPAQPSSPQPAPPALPVPAASANASAAYVNSDNGQVVSVGPAGSFEDWNTKAPVRQNVVVPATALIPDAAVVAVVKEQSVVTPPTAPSVAPSTPPTVTPSSSAPEQGAPVAAPEAQAVAQRQGFDAAPVIFGSTLILMGLAAVFFAYRSIVKSRNPVHGRRRASS